MKCKTHDYENNFWKGPKIIEGITGVTVSTQIELTRKSRHGIEKAPFLFSVWAPNALEIQNLGTGKSREYYFTEVLFLALSEQFKKNGIPKEIMSLFLVYFQFHIETNPTDPSIKLLSDQNGLINLPAFISSRETKDAKYEKGTFENILWSFQIDTLITRERVGRIICENYLYNKKKKKPVKRFTIFELSFNIEDSSEEICELQTRKEPTLQPLPQYSEMNVASQIKFNLNSIFEEVVRNMSIPMNPKLKIRK